MRATMAASAKLTRRLTGAAKRAAVASAAFGVLGVRGETIGTRRCLLVVRAAGLPPGAHGFGRSVFRNHALEESCQWYAHRPPSCRTRSRRKLRRRSRLLLIIQAPCHGSGSNENRRNINGLRPLSEHPRT